MTAYGKHLDKLLLIVCIVLVVEWLSPEPTPAPAPAPPPTTLPPTLEPTLVPTPAPPVNFSLSLSVCDTLHMSHFLICFKADFAAGVELQHVWNGLSLPPEVGKTNVLINAGAPTLLPEIRNVMFECQKRCALYHLKTATGIVNDTTAHVHTVDSLSDIILDANKTNLMGMFVNTDKGNDIRAALKIATTHRAQFVSFTMSSSSEMPPSALFEELWSHEFRLFLAIFAFPRKFVADIDKEKEQHLAMTPELRDLFAIHQKQVPRRRSEPLLLVELTPATAASIERTLGNTAYIFVALPAHEDLAHKLLVGTGDLGTYAISVPRIRTAKSMACRDTQKEMRKGCFRIYGAGVGDPPK